ncbi:32950_t:CDS:2 [Gigaspora margarita]|uniref:32950_t:CDS:1 n=1 Tax=Gigaspora margarita TaxID=4874 RepID=A0ABN7VDY5_GIGMA|nr:32950_t:CDS:2 [Gigaspora margarita]
MISSNKINGESNGRSNSGSNSGSNNTGNGRTSNSGYTSDENYDKLCDDHNGNSEVAQENNEAQNNSKGSSSE